MHAAVGATGTGDVDGFRDDNLRIPALTLFALEEPENHLSPYFLARIIRQVRSLTENGNAQALVTSHSPAVLSRVSPREVRYCRVDAKTRISSVKQITMPAGAGEETKFVRGAMLAYPELYFARFVLLVEGDSERIVLPRLAEALDLLIDPAFVAVVPLGGRHVQHFWRLLTDLGIPFATLLDLDLGRDGGGFGRVKTAIEKLIAFGAPKAELLATDKGMLTDAEFAQMHTWKDSTLLEGWANFLKGYGVYFSAPLDLDLCMLAAFPAAYQAIIAKGGGPKMAADKAAEVVLGTAGAGAAAYTGALSSYPPLMPDYRYHFLTNSKPATHLAALTHIKRAALARALALDPALVFLDEPTSGLDPIGAAEFDELIAKLRDTLGLTVYMVTHDLDSLFSVCDRIAVLGKKRVLVSGTVDDMLDCPDEWVQSYFRGKRARSSR